MITSAAALINITNRRTSQQPTCRMIRIKGFEYCLRVLIVAAHLLAEVLLYTKPKPRFVIFFFSSTGVYKRQIEPTLTTGSQRRIIVVKIQDPNPDRMPTDATLMNTT